jgi:hypothetical protein
MEWDGVNSHKFYIGGILIQENNPTITGLISSFNNVWICSQYVMSGVGVDFTGSCYSAKRDGFFEHKFRESDGTTVYDVSGNGNHGTVNGDLTNFWSTSDTQRPNNFIDGFDLWTNDTTSDNLYVPFDVNGDSIKTNGDAIAGYTWSDKRDGSKFAHNGAETQLQQQQVPELYNIGETFFTTNPWYSSLLPIPVSYDGIVENYEIANVWFNILYKLDPLKYYWTVYNAPISSDNVFNILRDEDGNIMRDEEGNILYSESN